MVNATCLPSNIRHPKDLSLLNEGREFTEKLLRLLFVFLTYLLQLVLLLGEAQSRQGMPLNHRLAPPQWLAREFNQNQILVSSPSSSPSQEASVTARLIASSKDWHLFMQGKIPVGLCHPSQQPLRFFLTTGQPADTANLEQRRIPVKGRRSVGIDLTSSADQYRQTFGNTE